MLMHTDGAQAPEVVHDDKFHDGRQKAERLLVDIGTMRYWVMPPGDQNNNGKATVRTHRGCYRELKEVMMEAAKRRSRQDLLNEFHKLNGLPAWAGIIEQKRRLADFVIRSSRKNEIWPPIKRDELKIITRRKPVPVWK